MRPIMVALLVLSFGSGCSWLFQDHLHSGLEGYRGRSEPHCSTSAGWALLDGAFAAVNIIGVLDAASDDTLENSDAIIAVGVLWGIVHIASAVTGTTWASDCQTAYKQWEGSDGGSLHGISPDEEHERQRLGQQLQGAEAARTFWCIPDGACFANRTACSGECVPRETAWCAAGKHNFICSETQRACFDARAGRDVSECTERHLNRPAATAPTAPPNPSNDPHLAAAFWCSKRDGVCSADELSCTGICQKTDEVWCARFAEHGSYGYLCGTTRDACLTLRDTPSYRKDRTDFGECIAQKASGQVDSALARPTPPPPGPTPTPASTPRGFFCSSSAASTVAGLCAREKPDCERGREAALGVVADLDECKLVEVAFCYTAGTVERCAPTMEACTARAGSATCAERR